MFSLSMNERANGNIILFIFLFCQLQSKRHSHFYSLCNMSVFLNSNLLSQSIKGPQEDTRLKFCYLLQLIFSWTLHLYDWTSSLEYAIIGSYTLGRLNNSRHFLLTSCRILQKRFSCNKLVSYIILPASIFITYSNSCLNKIDEQTKSQVYLDCWLNTV